MTSAADVVTAHQELVRVWRRKDEYLTRYLASFMADCEAKRTPGALSAMFWPAQSPADAGIWASHVGKDLLGSRVFQVTPKMCDAVHSTYQKSSVSGTHTIYTHELPADNGFVWFDQPIAMRDRRGKTVRHRAVSWAVLPVPARLGFADNARQCNALRIIIWSDTRIADDYSNQIPPAEWRRIERQTGRLQLLHAFTMPLDEPVTMSADDILQGDNELAAFHTLLMFLGTEVTDQQRAGLPQHVKKQMRGEVKRSGVTIITLRRIAIPDPDAAHGHREVDWKYRWPVQGHYRHIESYDAAKHYAIPDNTDAQHEHCAGCGKRITWVHPYIKGHESLELRPPKPVVYRLSR